MNIADFQTAVEDILAVPHGSLQYADTRDTIASWSSVADVQIVAFLGAELGVEADSELLEADTFGEIVHILEARGALAA